jgi:thiol-disulfide isomerase/thioredoxin
MLTTAKTAKMAKMATTELFGVRGLGRSAALALMFSVVLFGCADGTSAGGAQLGNRPEFRLKTTDGRVIGPKDFPGKVVVVDFWATWCAPCHLQAKILDPVAKDLQGTSVQFLATDVGEPEDTVRSFLRSSPFPYPVLLDVDNKVSDSFSINALPTLMVIDRAGRIAFLRAGLTDGDTLKRLIHQASL